MKPSNTLRSEEKPVEELEVLCLDEKDPKALANYYSQIIFQLLNVDLSKVKDWLEKLGALDGQEYSNFIRSKYQNALGAFHLTSGNYEPALEAFQATLEERVKNPEDHRGLSAIHNNISHIYRLLERFPESRRHILLARDFAEKAGVEESIINTMVAESVLLGQMSNMEAAIEVMLEGLRRAHKAKFYYQVQAFLKNCASAYITLGDFEKGLEMTQRRLNSPGLETNPIARMNAFFTLASCKFRLGFLKEADENIDKGKELLDQTAEFSKIPLPAILFAYDTMVDIAKHNKRFEQAIFLAKEFLFRLEGTDSARHLKSGEYILAKAYLASGDFQKALEHISRLDEDIESRKIDDQVLNASEVKYQIYKKLKQWDKALEYLEIFKELEAKRREKSRLREMELAKAEFDYTVEKAEAEMLRLQKVEFEQKALRAQMNPHFIFNSLNAVRNYINSEETEIADKFLVDFSKLIRSILSNSNKPYLSLEKNIEFLTCYMDLEAKRFRQSFTFSIDVLDELETDLIQIPTLLIQPFVENAIIHGLQGNKGGHISIKFSELSEDVIRCTIEDNGKGRKARAAEQGKENKSHVSMATDITNQRLASFGLDKEQGLKVAISDPQDKDGNALGTIVSIDIPIQLSL